MVERGVPQDPGVIPPVVAQRTVAPGYFETARIPLRQSGVVAGLGLGAGLLGAYGLTRLMGALLFGVTPTDPLTYGTVSVALLGVTMLASYLPACRAASIDPVQALKSE